MRVKSIFVMLLCVAVMGCERTYSPEEIAEAKAKKEAHCRDHLCEGDVIPKRDPKTEVVLKLNNQFFIGPNEYFSTGMNGAAFYWLRHQAVSRNEIHPESEIQRAMKEGKANEYSIEIFFRSNPNHLSSAPSRYQELLRAEKEGRLVSKRTLRPSLEVWHIKMNDGTRDGIWYVATKLKGADGYPPAGDPPVLWCDQHDPKYDRCTTGFWWKFGIATDMRFRAKHGPDWPEIYQETMHVLSLLRQD